MAARPEPLSVGRYRFLLELGSGGMGDVFLAIAQGPAGFNKLQVIKRLRPELAEDPEFLGMFLNEARIAARLNHPNVVQTNEVSEHEDEYFIAMEYLEGQSLHSVLRRAVAQGGARFPLPMHLHVLAEACEGLHYAHELADFDGTPLELVHRDCSPQNLFVTYEGQVKVLDFGIAKAADSANVTRTGVLKGKVPYMPPEQLEGRPVDRRCDVFAMGAMLWEAATGTRLWKGFNDIQIANRLSRGEVPRPSEVDPTIDPRLEALVMKALAPDPDERFQTAAELHAAIDHYASRLGGVRRRELGKYVSGLFADTRRALRAKLEEELREVVPAWRNLLSTGTHEIPVAVEASSRADSVGPTPISQVRAPETGARTRPTDEATATRPRPAEDPTAGVATWAGPRRAASGVDSIETRHSTALTVAPPAGEPGRRSRMLVLAGVVCVVALALAAVVVRTREVPVVEAPAAASKPPKVEPRPTEEPAPKPTAKPSASEELLEPPPLEPARPTASGSTIKKPVGMKPVGASPSGSGATTGGAKPSLDKGDPWQ